MVCDSELSALQAAFIDKPLEVAAILADKGDGAFVKAIKVHGAHERGVELGLAFLEVLASAMRAGDKFSRCGVAFGGIRLSKSKEAHGASFHLDVRRMNFTPMGCVAANGAHGIAGAQEI